MKFIQYLKNVREELLAIPLLLILVTLGQSYIAAVAPEAAQFNFWEETEGWLFRTGQFLVITLTVWVFLRIMFPLIFKTLNHYLFNPKGSRLTDFESIKVGLWVWTVVMFTFVLLLTSCSARASEPTVIHQDIITEDAVRAELSELLNAQLEVREATGANDGPAVEAYLRAVGLGKGYPWCAAFVAWSLDKVGVDNPRSAWSPNYARQEDIKWRPKTGGESPEPGDVFTVWYAHLGRVGHVGFVLKESGNHFVTIEGNTNEEGGRLGIGVFKRKRDMRKVYAVTDYITKHVSKSIQSHFNGGPDHGYHGLQAHRRCGAEDGQAGDRSYDLPGDSHDRYYLAASGHGADQQHTDTCRQHWSHQPGTGEAEGQHGISNGVDQRQQTHSPLHLRQLVPDPDHAKQGDRHAEVKHQRERGGEVGAPGAQVGMVDHGHWRNSRPGLGAVFNLHNQTNH